MKVTATRIPDVLVFEPKVFGDARGFFMESFNSRVFDDAVAMKLALASARRVDADDIRR